jgi:hypothetical protein
MCRHWISESNTIILGFFNKLSEPENGLLKWIFAPVALGSLESAGTRGLQKKVKIGNEVDARFQCGRMNT